MFFWLREIAGWLLVLCSLLLGRLALIYVDNRQVVEAGVVVLLALGILRAGILLIRISTAARISETGAAASSPTDSQQS